MACTVNNLAMFRLVLQEDLWRRALSLGNPKDEVFERYAKCLVKGASLSIGTMLGNLEGVPLLGLLREKKSICGGFSRSRGRQDFKSGGHLELW